MKICPSNGKAIRFTRARVKDPLNYSLVDTLIPEASSCKYLGIILRSDLSWANQVKHTAKKTWKALHFTMRILKKGNSNTTRLAYTSRVRLILDHVATCWDPNREGQMSALDRVQQKAVPNVCAHSAVPNHTNTAHNNNRPLFMHNVNINTHPQQFCYKLSPSFKCV